MKQKKLNAQIADINSKKLYIAFCSYKAARMACFKWHYSKSISSSKHIMFGVWEYGRFIGAVIYGRGANKNLLKPYKLEITEGCELTRVALDKHLNPVSRIVSTSLNLLKKYEPELKLVISFADERQGHLGKIYQAMNWIYAGKLKSTDEYYHNGRWVHQRTISSGMSISTANKIYKRRDGGFRYRYLYPLKKEIRKDLEIKYKDFKYPSGDNISNVSDVQSENGGSSPTSPLHNSFKGENKDE